MIAHAVLSFLLAATADAAVYCGEAVGERHAPCKPGRAERDAVMAKIEAALVQEGKWRERHGVELALREDMAEAKRRGREPSLRELRDWNASLVKLEEAEGEMRRAFSDVMKATQESYGVGPKRRLGRINGGHLDGQQTAWAPVIQESEDFVYRSGPAKNPAYLRWQAAANDGSETMDDGTVFVSLDVLRTAKKLGSPALVATTIAREAERFEMLVGKGGWSGKDSVEYRGYDRQEKTGAAIDLEDSEMRRVGRLRREFAGRAGPRELWPGYRAAPQSEDYPYRKPKDLAENFEAWKGAQDRLVEIRAQREEFNARLEARHRGGPEEGMRDGLNDPRHSCGGEGSWFGDYYVPSFPCGGAVRPPPEPVPAQPAVPPPAAVPAQPPIYAAPVYLLSGLAARICADPSSAFSPDNHEAYRRGVALSGDDGMEMSVCQREVYLNLRRIQREGYGDYDSGYFQSLAERLRSPLVPVPPDGPNPNVPTGPQVPDCILRPGGRCLHRN